MEHARYKHKVVQAMKESISKPQIVEEPEPEKNIVTLELPEELKGKVERYKLVKQQWDEGDESVAETLDALYNEIYEDLESVNVGEVFPFEVETDATTYVGETKYSKDETGRPDSIESEPEEVTVDVTMNLDDVEGPSSTLMDANAEFFVTYKVYFENNSQFGDDAMAQYVDDKEFLQDFPEAFVVETLGREVKLSGVGYDDESEKLMLKYEF